MQNQIDMKGFIQIALVVDDIEKGGEEVGRAVRRARSPIRDDKPRHDPNLTYRGEEAYYGLKFAVIDCRGARFRDRAARAGRASFDLPREFLDKHGNGVHHLSFRWATSATRSWASCPTWAMTCAPWATTPAPAGPSSIPRTTWA